MQNGRLVAFASRSLTNIEKNYAQIEKEMLAILYGLTKFERYVFGKEITVQSDHKPLETILKGSLRDAPKRLQRMMLAVQKFNFRMIYTKGSDLHIADTLSRAPLPDSLCATKLQEVCILHPSRSEEETQAEMVDMLSEISVSEETANMLRSATDKDPELLQLKKMVMTGWPDFRQDVPVHLRKYFGFRSKISTDGSLLFKGDRLMVPLEARKYLKQRLHASHLGLQGTLRRLRVNILAWHER